MTHSATDFFRQAAGMADSGPRFEHEETDTGGSKRPTKIDLHAVDSESGERMGTLTYHVPRRKADKLLIEHLGTKDGHTGKGVASALMDEMQRRHPATPIDHGDRTTDGKAWWSRYTDGKRVTKGRTIATVHPGPAAATFARQDGEDWMDHQQRVRRGLSLGHLTYEQANEHKYTGDSRQDTRHDGWGPAPDKPKGWQPLPPTLFHTTTDAAGVAAHGLRTGSEIGQKHGHGLGGTPDWLSLTHSAEHAHNMLNALHEYHDHLNGKTSYTDLHRAAQNGEGAQHPFHEAFESAVAAGEGDYAREARSRGKRLEPGFASYDEAKEKGWTPHPTLHTNLGQGKDGGTYGSGWERNASTEERHDEYGAFSRAREWHGKGTPSILFTSNDRKAFAAKDPSNFAVLKVRPKPGAQGFPMEGEHEWRTGTGDAVEAHGEPLRRTSGLIGGGVVRPFARAAGASGPLPDGLTFQHHEPGAALNHTLVAHHPDADHGAYPNQVGYLSWHPEGEVSELYVGPDHQRKGVATELWNRARQITPHLRHSDLQTADGAAWAQHVGRKTTATPSPEWTAEWGAGSKPCPCCNGVGEHGTGFECYLCDASKTVGKDTPEDYRCDGTLPDGGHSKTAGGEDAIELHRGLNLGLASPEDVEHLHRDPVGYMNKHGFDGTHTGIHWSASPLVAHNFALDHDDDEEDATPYTHGVVLHARVAPHHILQPGTDEWHRYADDTGIFSEDHPEEEHTVRMKAPVHVTHVTATSRHLYGGEDRETTAPWGHHVTASADTPVPDNTTPYKHDHDWLPHEHFFAPAKKDLDPRLFDSDKIRSEVRRYLLGLLNSFWAPKYGDSWQSWARVYLAGGAASHFWGDNNDLDVLVGVDYAALNQHCDAFNGEPEDAISDRLTTELKKGLNDDRRMLPAPDGSESGPWESTFFVIKPGPGGASDDIRRLHPYAAYDLTRDDWAVRPVETPDDFGPEKLPESSWDIVDAVRKLVDAVGELPEGVREREGAALYDYLHTDRSAAFGEQGSGLWDPANTTWKSLVAAPGEPLQQLIDWKHAAKPQEPAA